MFSQLIDSFRIVVVDLFFIIDDECEPMFLTTLQFELNFVSLLIFKVPKHVDFEEIGQLTDDLHSSHIII